MSLFPMEDAISFELGEALLREEDPFHPKPLFSGNGNGEIPREKYLVVIPSMRPVNLDYLEAIRKLNIFIADDSDGKVDRANLDNAVMDDWFAHFTVFSREDTKKYVGENNLWLFPNHSPSIKNIGLYYAWKEGYDAVILLDDDCDTRDREESDFLTIGKKVKSSILVVQLDDTPYHNGYYLFVIMNLHFPRDKHTILIQPKFNPREILTAVNSLAVEPEELPDTEVIEERNPLLGVERKITKTSKPQYKKLPTTKSGDLE